VYVRWKKRTRSRYHRPQDEQTLAAVLVESVRIDGKPRQRGYDGTFDRIDAKILYPLLDYFECKFEDLIERVD
jgi:hypothetical protein